MDGTFDRALNLQSGEASSTDIGKRSLSPIDVDGQHMTIADKAALERVLFCSNGLAGRHICLQPYGTSLVRSTAVHGVCKLLIFRIAVDG